MKTSKRQAKSGRLLTRLELATVFGCNARTIAKWVEEGLPIALRGRGGRPSRYNEIDCRAWKIARDAAAAQQPGAVDLLKERARKERAQAILAEQTFNIRTRELLPREEVRKVWAAEVAAVRAIALAWPHTIADQLARAFTLHGLAGLEARLEEAVEELLRQFADPDRPPTAPTSDGGTAVA